MCARLAPLLLLHVNLLLAVVAGAGLATAARLKWDPSTYIAVRELFPAEYRVAAALLVTASVLLLALAHAAAAAVLARPGCARRRALYLYAATMLALVVAEAAWAVWTALRVAAWLRSEQARQAMEMMEVADHLGPVLKYLSRWHPMPQKLKDLIEEARADLPANAYVAAAAAALAAALQPAGAALALLVARRPPRPRSRASSSWGGSRSGEQLVGAATPLKAKFRGGRLVLA